MDPIEIPDKTYFKIGEVARLLDLEPYVLRYWETEFDCLSPEKTRSNQRAYQRKDIELLHMIQTLLYEELFTIAGARQQLERMRNDEVPLRFDPRRVADLEEENHALDQAKTALEERLEESQAELARQTSEFEELRRERDRLAEEVETLRAHSSRMEGQIELVASNAPDPEEVERLRAELTRARNRIEELESDEARRDEGRRLSEQQRQHLARLRTQLEGLAGLAETSVH